MYYFSIISVRWHHVRRVWKVNDELLYTVRSLVIVRNRLPAQVVRMDSVIWNIFLSLSLSLWWNCWILRFYLLELTSNSIIILISLLSTCLKFQGEYIIFVFVRSCFELFWNMFFFNFEIILITVQTNYCETLEGFKEISPVVFCKFFATTKILEKMLSI